MNDLQGKMIVKLVFGERSKFLVNIPSSLSSLREEGGLVFGLISDINPEERASILDGLNFHYLDPQGDKVPIEIEEDLHKIYQFARIAE